jgi:hypothetical protein
MSLVIAAWLTLGFGLILTAFKRERDPRRVPRAVVVDEGRIVEPRRFRVAKLRLAIGIVLVVGFFATAAVVVLSAAGFRGD